MLLFSVLFQLVLFIFTNSVTCREGTDSNNARKEKNIFTNYQFNHPPSVENYNPIPVAVVFDNGDAYNEKSEVNTKAIELKTDVTTIVAKEINVPTTTEKEVTDKPYDMSNKTKLVISPQPRVLNDLQIPVSIVYESDVTNQNIHRTKTETNTKMPRRRLVRRKNQLVNPNVHKELLNATSSRKPEVDPINVKKKTFEKRTEGRDPIVPIIESENYVFSHNGNFHYRYEGGDGTKAYSNGKLKTVEEQTGETVVGGFSYTDKEGNDFSLSYTADENGYRPVGAHLPTPPPIPPAIARALEYLATATPEPVTKQPVKS